MLCGCIPDVVIVYEDKYSNHVVTQSKYPIAMLDERLEKQTTVISHAVCGRVYSIGYHFLNQLNTTKEVTVVVS